MQPRGSRWVAIRRNCHAAFERPSWLEHLAMDVEAPTPPKVMKNARRFRPPVGSGLMHPSTKKQKGLPQREDAIGIAEVPCVCPYRIEHGAEQVVERRVLRELEDLPGGDRPPSTPGQ